MYCLTRKIEYYEASCKCSEGLATLEVLFNNMTHLSFETQNCTASGYSTWEDFKLNVEANMIRTGKQTDCLLNDYKVQLDVCNSWYTGSAHEYTLTAEYEDYFISVCPPGDGTSLQVTDSVCQNKYEGKDEATVVRAFYKYLSSDISNTFNQCPPKA